MLLLVVVVFTIALYFGIGRKTEIIGKQGTDRPPKVVTGTQVLQDAKNSVLTTSSDQPTSSSQQADVVQAKPKDTHASSILQSKEYQQHRYTALLAPNDGQYSGSWYQQKLQTNRAWDVTTGSNATVIADIDTGFALDHQDLVNKWYTNSREQGQTASGDVCWTGTPADKATNNCDDDQNGYVDDWRGWDFNSSDNNPQTGLTDPQGAGTEHGTMTSGIIAASSNNIVGNAGIDWQAKIMPLQVLDDDGSGYTFDIVAAVQYATDNGASIINMSLGGPDFDQAMLDAVNYATAHGVLVVAASGNCGNSSTDDCADMQAPGRMAYPAKYDNVLSVGASTNSDNRAAFSSYGPELDMVAPGNSVGPLASWSSSIPTDGYVSYASGTSFAAPMVSGLAGLVRAKLGSPSVSQLRSVLLDSVDKVTGMSGQTRTDYYGFGRANAHKATLLAKAVASPPTGLGSASIQSRQAPVGGLVRSTTGSVQSDEWVVLVCRVEATDVCSGSVIQGASNLSVMATNTQKGDQIYYLFVQGASLPAGTSSLNISGRNYASKVADITH